MIRGIVQGKNGPILMLGLTAENLRRLPDDKPILVDVAAMGAAGPISEVCIFAGEDENAMLEQFMKAGIITADTELSIDPRTIPDRPPVDVVDTAIFRVPKQFEMTDADSAQRIGAELQSTLRGLAQKLIAEGQELPRDVRKVEIQQLVWTILGNPDELAAMTPPHDCPKCRAGMAAAAEDLRATPGMMAVGRLEYRMHFASA